MASRPLSIQETNANACRGVVKDFDRADFSDLVLGAARNRHGFDSTLVLGTDAYRATLTFNSHGAVHEVKLIEQGQRVFWVSSLDAITAHDILDAVVAACRQGSAKPVQEFFATPSLRKSLSVLTHK